MFAFCALFVRNVLEDAPPQSGKENQERGRHRFSRNHRMVVKKDLCAHSAPGAKSDWSREDQCEPRDRCIDGCQGHDFCHHTIFLPAKILVSLP